jgi:hypothetical protein
MGQKLPLSKRLDMAKKGRFLPPVMYRFYHSVADGKCGSTSPIKNSPEYLGFACC